jgi:hypothetical protein
MTIRPRMYRPRTFFLGSYVPWTISAPWTICPLEDASLTNVFRPQGADPPPSPRGEGR